MPGDVSSWATKPFNYVTNLFPSNKDQMCQLSRCTIASSWSIPSYLNISKLPHQSPQLRSPAGMPPSRKAAIWAYALRLRLVEVLAGWTNVVLVNDGRNQIILGKTVGKLWENLRESEAWHVPSTLLQRVLPTWKIWILQQSGRTTFSWGWNHPTTLPVASLGSIHRTHRTAPWPAAHSRWQRPPGSPIMTGIQPKNWIGELVVPPGKLT